MYSRVTLLEIDTVRIGVAEAAELFKEQVLPQLSEQDGFEGAVVLATPEGKGMIITVWETEEAAASTAAFAAGVLETHMALFKAPPGREYYEVVFAQMPGVTVG
jgi:heme-degrading monooxygenase HmoA